MHYVLLLNSKVRKDPIKRQESIMDTAWSSLENHPFSYKINMEKGTRGKNSYIFETIFIFKCKSVEAPDKASTVYSG